MRYMIVVPATNRLPQIEYESFRVDVVFQRNHPIDLGKFVFDQSNGIGFFWMSWRIYKIYGAASLNHTYGFYDY